MAVELNTLPNIYDKKQKMEANYKKRVKKNQYYVHEETDNLSFLKMYRNLKLLKVKNNDFFLALYDERLRDVDPYDEDLSDEMKILIQRECINNFWYFVREVVRIPVAGAKDPIQFRLHRGNLAACYCAINSINYYLEMPRQNGKTVGADVVILWFYNFGTRNSEISIQHIDHAKAKGNLEHIKKMRDALPEYLRLNEVESDTTGKALKTIENVETAMNRHTGNKIVTISSATSVEKAEEKGRGSTQPIQHIDEFAWRRYNMVSYDAATFANKQAAEECEKQGMPHCKMITTTPGDMSTEYGQDAFTFRNKCAKFSEAFYDRPAKENKEWVYQNSENDFVHIAYSWKQLGRDTRYYDECKKAVSGNWFKFRREVLLEWIIINDDPIFNEEALQNLIQYSNERQVIKEINIDKYYTLYLYEHIDPHKSYIISCDVASGTDRDNSALVIIDSRTKAVVGEFKNNTIDTTDFSYFIYTVAKHIVKHCMIVIERNNVGAVIISNLRKTDVASKLYFEDDKKDYQEKIVNGKLKDESNNVLHQYGVWTTAEKKAQMHEILVRYVDNYYKRVGTKMLAQEIQELKFNKKHIIDHTDEGHDDLVMAYLIGMWVYFYGKRLSRFGILPVPDVDPESELSEEELELQEISKIEARRERQNDLADFVQESYYNAQTGRDISSSKNNNGKLETVNDVLRMFEEQKDRAFNNLESKRNSHKLSDIVGSNKRRGINPAKSNFMTGIGFGESTYADDMISGILDKDI